jgi:hypothetical protein
MSAYTIGENCHITLAHPAIDSGAEFGFILGPSSPGDLFSEAGRRKGPCVSVQREVQAGGEVNVRIYFSVLLAESLVNPDGTTHSDSRADMYARIQNLLSQTEGLTIATEIGVFSAIGALGHSATEMHYAALSVITCQLNNVGAYYPPADPERLGLSTWSGTLSWADSYWR